jgi:hypothetical protein
MACVVGHIVGHIGKVNHWKSESLKSESLEIKWIIGKVNHWKSEPLEKWIIGKVNHWKEWIVISLNTLEIEQVNRKKNNEQYETLTTSTLPSSTPSNGSVAWLAWLAWEEKDNQRSRVNSKQACTGRTTG